MKQARKDLITFNIGDKFHELDKRIVNAIRVAIWANHRLGEFIPIPLIDDFDLKQANLVKHSARMIIQQFQDFFCLQFLTQEAFFSFAVDSEFFECQFFQFQFIVLHQIPVGGIEVGIVFKDNTIGTRAK